MLVIAVIVFFSININFLKTAFSSTCRECGDKCLIDDTISMCQCGNETFYPQTSFQHCCIASNQTCYTENSSPYNVVCREGEVKPMYMPCENTERSLQCFNSYQDNEQNDPLYSHYTCPDICVPISKMCKGVSWCEKDEEECGPNLRCNPTRRSILGSVCLTNWHRKT